MSCESVQERISFHLDGLLTREEWAGVLAHMEGCRPCYVRWKSMESLRANLGRMNRPPVPEKLAMQLRVLASHEQVRRLAYSSWSARARYWAARARLSFDNLMRPVALPIAGGLFSALLLFGILVPNLTFHHNFTNDPPLSLSVDPDGRVVDWTGDLPRLEPVNADVSGADTVVELTIDMQGRVVDYDVLRGQLTPAVENIIMFSKFTPALFFYQPAWGKKLVVVSGRRNARG